MRGCFSDGEEIFGLLLGDELGGLLIVSVQDGEFFRVSWSREKNFERAFQNGFGIGRRFHGGTIHQSAGRFRIVWVVENSESVERAVGAGGADFAHFAFSYVEEHGRSADATPKGVDAATTEFFAGVGGVFLFAKGNLGPQSWWLPWFDGGTADGVDEIATGCERLIADHPGREAESRPTGEESIVGIAFKLDRRPLGGLAINAAGDNSADEMFVVPLVFHEVGSEPVEEFGMNGDLALHAEVFRAFDKTDAEEFLPKAIYGNA